MKKNFVTKVIALAKASKDASQTVFTRVISNATDPDIKDWIGQIKNATDPCYGELHPFIKSGQVKIYTTDSPVGMDLLMVAGRTRKTVLLGVKEEPPDLYLNKYHGQLISRGYTFIFENGCVC